MKIRCYVDECPVVKVKDGVFIIDYRQTEDGPPLAPMLDSSELPAIVDCIVERIAYGKLVVELP